MQYLDGIFGPNMLALKSIQGKSWAPSSPDMNPCDFWLWGDLKEKVYKPLPASIDELKQSITRHFNNLEAATISKAVKSMQKRARLLVQSEGKAFEGREKRLRI